MNRLYLLMPDSPHTVPVPTRVRTVDDLGEFVSRLAELTDAFGYYVVFPAASPEEINLRGSIGRVYKHRGRAVECLVAQSEIDESYAYGPID